MFTRPDSVDATATAAAAAAATAGGWTKSPTARHSSSFTSEDGCVSDGGYRSSNEGTPERCRAEHHHHNHHHRRHRCSRRAAEKHEMESDCSHDEAAATTTTTTTSDAHRSSDSNSSSSGAVLAAAGAAAGARAGEKPHPRDGNFPADAKRIFEGVFSPHTRAAAPLEGAGAGKFAPPTITITAAAAPSPSPATTTATAPQQRTQLEELQQPPVDVSSSSSVGGHHLSLTEGRTFMKQSNSRREEAFYGLIAPHQEELVQLTVERWRRRQAAAAVEAAGSDTPLGPNAALSRHPRGSARGDDDAVEKAESQWWRELRADYRRGDVTAYEVQRRAAMQGNSPASAAATAHENATPMGSVAPTPSARSVASETELRGSFRLPPADVYEADKERALQLLAPFVPRYRGLRQLPMRRLTGIAATTTTTAAAAPKAAPAARPTDADDNDDEEGGGGGGGAAAAALCQMIVLEDVCHNFAHPCVLDMKMGQRQYGMHPTPEKKKKKEYRCKISTSGRYGIRLAGLRRWDEKTQTYETRAKRECRTFTLSQVKQELSAFFNGSRALERKFGEQLERLRIAFAQQNIFQFFTSSLLFVYDAARPLETCRLVMVDFAFTYERRELALGRDPGAEFEYDLGYLKALDTLLALMA